MTKDYEIQTINSQNNKGTINIQEIDGQILFNDSVEMKKAEARTALEKRLPGGYAAYVASQLYSITELSMSIEDGKGLHTALGAIKEINNMMGINQQNKQFTIQSNVPILTAEEASKH